MQWVLAYLAGAWALIEVVSTLQDGLGWPSAVFPILVAALAVGFVLTLVLAWYHGEQGRQRVSGPELLIISGILGVVALLVSMRGLPSPAADGASDGPVVERSVAVLPFVNMSGNPDNEYFSDGVAEEIRNALARLPGLRVSGRTSSFAFKGQGLTIREIAETLDVAYVLDGSVRRTGDRVRIAPQLIDARSDRLLWSETYERDLEDIFVIQREIAGAVADTLQVELGGPATVLVDAVPTRSQEAHDLYLRGRFELSKRGESVAAAIRYFEQAVENDSTYARAYGGLALASALGATYGAGNPAELREAALAAADRALSLDSTLSEPHTARGYLPTRIGGVLAAELELRRAIELDPDDANAHHFLGWALMARGRWDEAELSLTRAILLDPSNPAHHWRRANFHAFTGNWIEGEADAREALRLSPDDRFAVSLLATCLAMSGQVQELRAVAPELEATIGVAEVIDDPGRLDDALRRMSSANPLVGPWMAAWLDRPVLSAELAERTFGGLDPQLGGFAIPGTLSSMALTSVRDEPRFQALLERFRIEGD